MTKENIVVNGINITIDKSNYVSLTDIAKYSDSVKPMLIIQAWFKNQSTFAYLNTWEKIHNPNFKNNQMEKLKVDFINDNQYPLEIYIEKTKSTGITFSNDTEEAIHAHVDIASNFCYWLSPEFQVYFLKALKELN